ncbi:AAA family ATPase [Burkholderia cepacia]|uniref:AAA family ATPase n=1 Tax=Burkholderia cepacia TaxID=292 RepID=UPI0009BD0ECA|nr:AAA family ATPase [Burkholderia cepacia]
MTSSRLLAITISKFKGIYETTRVEFGQVTVFLGKNNSGKSTITQALLLLKQTLELARVETTLHLDGYVTAINLKELISGWPEGEDDRVEGPNFSLEWSSWVDVSAALEMSGSPDINTLVENASLPWIKAAQGGLVQLFTRIDLAYSDVKGKVILDRVELRSSLTENLSDDYNLEATVKIERGEDARYECRWNNHVAKKMEVSLHHFIPSLSINRRNVGPRDRQRSFANAFNILFAQPLDDLEELLKGFSYLSSTRGLPPPFYPPGSSGGDDLGVSGEFAPQLLYAHREDLVHYLLPDFEDINKQPIFRERPLSEAINEVLNGLGIDTPLSIHEIEKVGFRLMFGRATLSHVGRGLTYLLPIVQLGLFSDPKRFRKISDSESPYEKTENRLCAFEEPESHLHPKVQSRLASWFVALGRAHRQVIVETHSDHLVRRLRVLMAQSSPHSEIEEWLSDNIRIVSVDQTDGRTTIETTRIHRDGGMEIWPADFMDAAVKGEEAIYYAAMDKEDVTPAGMASEIVHEDKDEPDAGR